MKRVLFVFASLVGTLLWGCGFASLDSGSVLNTQVQGETQSSPTGDSAAESPAIIVGPAGPAGPQGEKGDPSRDLTGLIARAQIDAQGANISGAANVASARLARGIYSVVVTVSESLDTGAATRDYYDFPVQVTPWELPISDEVRATMLGSFEPFAYEDTDGNGLRDRLTVKVYIRLILTGLPQLWDGGFSVLVLEP